MWHQTPGNFAEQRLPILRERWSGSWREIRQSVESMHSRFFPGVPTTAWVALTAYVDNPSDQVVAEGDFHAIGLYQTLAGEVSGSAPNSNPTALGNAWGRLATDPLVYRSLGRNAVMEANAWKTHIPDQIAIGLADYRQNLIDVDEMIGLELGGNFNTQWGFMVSVLAYGLGSERAKQIIERYARTIATVPEESRFGALLEVAARDAQLPPWMAHRLVRAWQVLMAGTALAVDQSLTGDYPFYAISSTWTAEQSLQYQDILSSKANQAALQDGVQTFGTTPAHAPANNMKAIGMVVLLSAAGGAAWWYLNRRKK